MTTTPYSRIRADWTLPAETAETAAPPPTVAPDTSTTAGKIAVMQQAHDDGRNVQYRFKKKEMDWEFVGGRPLWDWDTTDYRIAPPPVARTALQLARERMMAVLADEAAAGDVQLAVLVREIDSSPTLHIHGSGSQANIDWTKTDSRPLQPGRYRLVRDDA